MDPCVQATDSLNKLSICVIAIAVLSSFRLVSDTEVAVLFLFVWLMLNRERAFSRQCGAGNAHWRVNRQLTFGGKESKR